MGTINPEMGIMDVGRAGRQGSLADALFTTTQQRLLGLLFGQPGRSYYANEMIALTGGGSGAVQRELGRLVTSGLVESRRIGRQKHYQANPDSPIFEELCGIASKTMGLADPLRRTLEPIAPRIVAAFVYGSIAKRRDTASSDIDVMIVSDELDYADVFVVLDAASDRLGREVKPTIYSRREWAARAAAGDGFVKRVLAQPRVWLIGDENDIAES